MHLSVKKKNLSQCFAGFLKSNLNLERFEKKGEPHSFCISEITGSENMVTYMPKNSSFRGSFNKQKGKRVQAL